MPADKAEKQHAIATTNPAIVRALATAHDSLRRFLRRTIRNQEEADDVMQDFYLRVLTHGGQLREEESGRAWLGRVLRSVLTDYFRREAGRHRAEATFARKETAILPPEDTIDATACMCLHLVLPALKPEFAETLRRVDLAEEPREAVAAALGLTTRALAVRVHRARRALRGILETTCETCPVHGYLDCGCDYSKRFRSTRQGRGGGPPEL